MYSLCVTSCRGQKQRRVPQKAKKYLIIFQVFLFFSRCERVDHALFFLFLFGFFVLGIFTGVEENVRKFGGFWDSCYRFRLFLSDRKMRNLVCAVIKKPPLLCSFLLCSFFAVIGLEKRFFFVFFFFFFFFFFLFFLFC